MADMEKVLKGLEACADRTGALCRTCPYDFRKESCISDMAEDALELLKEQPEQEHGHWISVKDRMPAETHSMFYKLYGTPKWRNNAMWREESDHVLVAIAFEDGSQFVTSGYTQDGKWSTGISKMLQFTVTHWMPLPEPPKEAKQDET